MNNDLRPINTLPNFKRFCMTIGELPTSYLETMTYYEMLVWFTEYMKNTIIPTINNNGLAIQELQDKYIELKSFVDNYFDNLDVQEEINNKLDEMAESGQLTDIIAQYLGLAGMLVFNTVSDMKLAENLVNGSICQTLGYYEINDGGKSIYKIRNITNQDIIDEGSIIALSDENLIAELINNEINVDQFGAKGDDTTNDYTSFVNAINYCNSKNKILNTNENKTYKINSELVISCTINSKGIIDGDIVFNFMQDKVHFINNVTGKVTLKGWSNKFTINKAGSLYIDGVSNNFGFAWNKINFERIGGITLDSKNNGFINENIFTGGNGSSLLLTTSTATGGEINNNTFMNCDFSGGVTQEDYTNKSNNLINCYVEGESKIINGNFNHISGTYSNIPNVGILNSSILMSSAFARANKDFLSASTSNLAIGGSWEKLNTKGVPLCYSSNPNTLTVIEDTTNPDGSDKALSINWPGTQSWLYFRISINKLLRYGGCLTLLLRGFELPRGATLRKSDGTEATIVGTKTQISDDWFLYRYSIPPSSVKYTRIDMYATTSGTLGETKTTYFGGCHLSPYKTGFLPYVNKLPIRAELSTAPTAGIWDVGDIIIDSTGTKIGWICTEAPLTFVEIGNVQ